MLGAGVSAGLVMNSLALTPMGSCEEVRRIRIE